MKLKIVLFTSLLAVGLACGIYATTFLRASSAFAKNVQQYTALPTQIEIDKIGLNTHIEHVGLDAKGAMDVPKDINNVAWYKLGAIPGNVGSAVIAGHYDSPTGPALFYNLNSLEPGDTIKIMYADGKTATFIVTHKATYDFDTFPLQTVFNTNDKPRLNLITCAGIFNREDKNYSKRLVVFTELK